MGTPEFSVGTLEALIHAGHDVCLAVTQPDKPRGRGKEMQFPPVKETALSHGIPVFQPKRIRDPQCVEELKKYDEESIYIIGGESIYRQMLPYCDVAHVTKIDHAYEADAYFPDLDSDPEWEITADSDEQVYFDITYQFLKYERKKS